MDMVQETTQRVSALPASPKAVAFFKKEGLNRLLSVGNAVVSQATKSKSSKAGAWLSFGAVAAVAAFQAAHARGVRSWKCY